MKKLVLSALLFSAVLMSCSKDENNDPVPEPKSNMAQITSFTFPALAPPVTATIDEAAKSIRATVPNGTDVQSLAPAITVSDKAVVSPGTAVAANFSQPVTYTVTAEDKSTVSYTVTITEDSEVSFTIDSRYPRSIDQGSVYIVDGDGFGDPANNKIVFINQISKVETEIAVNVLSHNKTLYVRLPDDMQTGRYSLKIMIGKQWQILSEDIMVEIHSPVIESVEPETVELRGQLVIRGAYFMDEGNTVRLGSVAIPVVSESATSITVSIPQSLVTGEYTLFVVSSGKTTSHGPKITVVQPVSDPVLTDMNYEYRKGETMEITGTGFKKEGVATRIKLQSFYHPDNQAQLYIATPNEDGTVVSWSIPADFPTDGYTVSVLVGDVESNKYRNVVSIVP